MTPTLAGRWQTRWFMLGVVGIPVTLVWASVHDLDARSLFSILAYVGVLGSLWDPLYQRLQARRWDYDWPVFLSIAAGVWEALWIWLFLGADWVWRALGLLAAPGLDMTPSATGFAAHYACVWLAMFCAVQGPVKVLFPMWRFRGGTFLGPS